MTVGEAARLRCLRRAYVLELVRTGRLPFEVLFGRVLVRRRDIERIERGRPWRKPRLRMAPHPDPSADDIPAARPHPKAP